MYVRLPLQWKIIAISIHKQSSMQLVGLGILIVANIGSHFVNGGVLLPNLTNTQVAQVQNAIESGVLTRIANELTLNGVIYANNTSFGPIFTLTPSQEAVLNLCYRADPQESPSVGSTRKRRDTLIDQSSSAQCKPTATTNVDYIVDVHGNNIMVVDTIPQPTSCSGSCGRSNSGTCCLADFPINAVCWVLGSLNSLTFAQFNVKHCTCFN